VIDDLIVTLTAMSKRYGASPKQFRRWIKHDGFPAFKINNTGPWRVRHERAMKWFSQHEPQDAVKGL